MGLGVPGIVLAYIFYQKAKRDKEPCWALQTVNLIRDYSQGLSDLEVLYQGEKEEIFLFLSSFFWNHGSLTINHNDLVDADPLRIIAIEGNRPLDVKILIVNNRASRVDVFISPERLSAKVNFEYLDRGHGFVAQVVHQGTSSNDLMLQGSIKGAPPFVQIDPQDFLFKSRNERLKEILGRSSSVILVFVFTIFLFSTLWKFTWWLKPIAILTGFLRLYLTFLGVRMLSKLLRLQAPRGLDIFYGDPRIGLVKNR